MRLSFVAVIGLLVLAGTGFAPADTLRVATYNVLNLDEESIADREEYFATVMESIQPDMIALQEVRDEEAVDQFLSFVLLQTADDWVSVEYNNSSYNDNAFFYRSSKLSFIGQRHILTTLRDITEYTVRPHALDGSEVVYVYSAHLKAGNDPSDRSRRRSEVLTLRAELDQLPEDALFMFVGDFNLYTSEEDAYQILLDSMPSVNGQLFDPIDRPGNWHNTVSHADIHTQASRANFGGMDDRFDFMLVSAALMNTGGSHVLPESYTSWGNDGLHFNQSINDGVNQAVPEEVADALHFASDHLPVVVDVVFTPTSMNFREPDFAIANSFYLHCCPNPFNPSTTIHYSIDKQSLVTVAVYDLLGRQTDELVNGVMPAGNHHVNWNAQGHANGVYLIRLRSGDYTQTQKALLIR